MATIPNIGATRLIVGGQLPSGITVKQTIPYDLSPLGGLSILNGPVQIGVAPLAPIPLGTTVIGPNPPTSGPPSLASLHILHPKIGMNVIAPVAGNMFGVFNTFAFQQAFGSDFSFGLKQTLGLFSKVGKGVEVGGTTKAEPKIVEAAPAIRTAGDHNHAGTFTATQFVGPLTGVASGNKVLPFDIPHVTQKGKRIRHVIAEGPEAGIYIRGKIKDTNVIELPEYWNGLVDPETITVTLTQIGCSQDLIVDRIEWGKNIIIRSGAGVNINCFYEVWASRWINPMDHDEKLHVVYDGETPDDYPGDKKQFLVGGWDYDRRNTQWEEVNKNA